MPIERLTAAGAEHRQRAFAAALAARRLGPGDRVAVVAPSSAALLCLTLGALRSGVVPVLLKPELTGAEQEALLADAEPALVVRGDPELLALEATGEGAAGGGAGRELAPWPLARPMHYTSGTTGTPKGVWSGVLADDEAAALLAEERDLWGFDRSDVHLVLSPLHHSAPVRFAAGTLLAGGEVVILGGFDPGVALQAMAGERPTTTFCVPTHLQRLRAAEQEAPTGAFRSLRLVAHAGAPCPDPLKRWALERFPAGSVWEFYGSTEGQLTACSPGEWLDRPGTVGRARPGRRLEVDSDGVVWCEVPAHARFEYWRDPARTATAWRATRAGGRAFTVGDLGRLDDDGYLFLEGRRDDLVITGGLNVYPVEVERVLAEMPGVHDVAVFGADDEEWGQRVCAAVVGEVEPGAVVAYARRRLAAYKCPKTVVVVEGIPRSAFGKVPRASLAATLGLGRGSPAGQ